MKRKTSTSLWCEVGEGRSVWVIGDVDLDDDLLEKFLGKKVEPENDTMPAVAVHVALRRWRSFFR
jgi:hypothetical protein